MSTYPPLGTLKPMGKELWIVDGPAVICRRMPISTRATVIRLADGGLWVHSPTGLCDALQRDLQALGPVAHLVAPNWSHTGFMADWRAAYPDARVWAVPPEGARGPGITFDTGLDEETPWRDEIDHLIVGGSRKYREAVFFHRATATLIVADLIQNFETGRLPVWMRPLIWLAGTDDSAGNMPYLMRRAYRSAGLAPSVEQMVAWQPRQMILSHGRCYETGALRELERIFRKLLHERQWARAMDAAERSAKNGR